MPQVTDFTALLGGSSINGTTGVGAFISYSFATSVPDYVAGAFAGPGLSTFRTFTADEMANTRASLNAWSAVSGITFFEVAPADGDMKFMGFDLQAIGSAQSVAGFAYGPDNGFPYSGLSSDVFIDVQSATVSAVSSVNGTARTHTLLHEIGHALGLKHPFDGDVTLATSLDNYAQTVLSYTPSGTAGSMLGPLDVQAIQYLYGTRAAAGQQVASWSWDANALILTQQGTSAADTIFGIGGTDVISAGGGNDSIVGRGGNDRLDGGDGNDILLGGDGNDLLIGGAGDDLLQGDSGANTLQGGAGNDTLRSDGNRGDVLDGGTGDDIISVRPIAYADLPTLIGGDGTDTLILSFTDAGPFDFALSKLSASGFERFTIATGAGNDSLVADVAGTNVSLSGGAGNDTLRAINAGGTLDGGDGDDALYAGNGDINLKGGAGNDLLVTGSGASALYGGAGSDTFLIGQLDASGKVDSILDFQVGVDVLDLSLLSASSVRVSGNSTGTWVYATATTGQFQIYVSGTITTADIYSGVAVATANADQLIGGARDDRIDGLDGNDRIDGKAGNDTLIGGLGNDTLIGGSGLDLLQGGRGDDVYLIDDADDVIVEAPGEGNDLATIGATNFMLTASASIERIEAIAGIASINITGNEFSQAIVGNAGANILNGFGGGDTLTGLGGNDQYLVRSLGDVVIEANGGGTDTVFTTVSYNLGVNEVEVLSTVENAAATPIDLIGNFATQLVIGNYGNNVLNGGSGGIDTLIGLRGDDIYAVGDARVSVVENAGEGNDVVVTSVSYALAFGISIEVLSAQNRAGTDALRLTGNELAQTIVGNEGNNHIDGGAGDDVLMGGGGADLFAFTTALGNGNVDAITDFQPGTDRIGLLDTLFAVGGAVTANNFVNGVVARDSDDRILFNQATGQLFYDADGSGAGAAIPFATVTPGLALTSSNFEMLPGSG